MGIILAANKILREKSFFASKKSFYGLAESARPHKRDGRVPRAHKYIPPYSTLNLAATRLELEGENAREREREKDTRSRSIYVCTC